MTGQKFASIDDYLDSLSPEVRAAVEEVRAIVNAEVPDGEETISYHMPTVRRGGQAVVHYAGWKKHVSLYPVPAVDEDLERELAPYLSGRGTLKFPLGQPLPRELVAQVVRLLSDAAR